MFNRLSKDVERELAVLCWAMNLFSGYLVPHYTSLCFPWSIGQQYTRFWSGTVSVLRCCVWKTHGFWKSSWVSQILQTYMEWWSPQLLQHILNRAWMCTNFVATLFIETFHSEPKLSPSSLWLNEKTGDHVSSIHPHWIMDVFTTFPYRAGTDQTLYL